MLADPRSQRLPRRRPPRLAAQLVHPRQGGQHRRGRRCPGGRADGVALVVALAVRRRQALVGAARGPACWIGTVDDRPHEPLLALVYGLGSALGAGPQRRGLRAGVRGPTRTPALAVAAVLALAVGQTAGKLLFFEAARAARVHWSGGSRTAARVGPPAGPADPRLTPLAARSGLPLVLASAALGLPPLAAVSLAAGVRAASVGLRGRCACSDGPPGSPCWCCPPSGRSRETGLPPRLLTWVRVRPLACPHDRRRDRRPERGRRRRRRAGRPGRRQRGRRGARGRLVAMVNEVGLVSLSSGGFVTVQPPGGGGVHRGRLDGHARPRAGSPTARPGTSRPSTAAGSRSPSVRGRWPRTGPWPRSARPTRATGGCRGARWSRRRSTWPAAGSG